MNIRICEPNSADEVALDAFLDDRLYEFNMAATGLRDGRAFAATVTEQSDDIVAAINGHTWGGCCYVAHLWVHESRRGRGIGRDLLQAAEHEALRRGCVQMLLATHSFQAPAFYERLGYVRRATVPDYPRGHAQHVYVKQLSVDAGD